MRLLVALLTVSGCLGTGPSTSEPPPGDPPSQDSEPQPVSVVLDQLQPGWLVTTNRSTDHAAPVEDTIVSDGTPITLDGGATDVFVATVTDGNGALIESRAMTSPCTMASSRQLHVPSEYATIQSAINAAHPGETVRVSAGTYSESVVMRPGVCLLGSGAKHTILDAHGEGRTLIDLTAAPGSVVSGFTLRGTQQTEGCARPDEPFLCSGNWYRAGIYIGGETWHDPTHDAPPIITNNLFVDNDTAVMFYWRSQAVLRNNVFLDNRLGFIANHFQDRSLIANNVFVNNTELAIGNQAAYLDIIDNIIVGSQSAIEFEYIQTGHIQCNLFFGNGRLTNDPSRFQLGTNGNMGVAPKFVGNGDWHLQPGSPAINAGCHPNAHEPDGTRTDLGAFGGPLAAWVDL
jgi:hypothetical protein